ncbi:MAG: diadenylate cyclase CdaA [Verrucomicrobiota bacterium]
MNIEQPLGLFAEFLRTMCEIGILAISFYYILIFLRGTRSATVLAGFIIFALVLNFISAALQLEVLEWLLSRMWAVAALGLIIIFQPEIRRVFAEVGSSQARFRNTSREEKKRIDIIVNSVVYLARHRIGALIAIERDIGMRSITETGTRINAPLSQELLTTFFFPDTPLHDGGVVIKGGMILAASCIFPLTHDQNLSKSLGTRHRAGVGLAEETDAVVLIVSEETGAISLAYKGRLIRGLNRQRLERHLVAHLLRNRDKEQQKKSSKNLPEAKLAATPEKESEETMVAEEPSGK